ncbi:glycoside hydrolase family 18 protein [Alloacidobacterium dinghuense]|uniref:chitinase n=2 Tax=Alloacidobacterium dinghuense TaxID=2763107 RepID=A0A7G8BQZ0_9BACT|nr:glycoside hydrolase family 18 protein [Alloacidobacterium dinghuense]
MLDLPGPQFLLRSLKRSICLCCVMLPFLALPRLFASTPDKVSQPAIVAYVFPGNSLIQPGDIAARKLTRINFAFALIQNGKISTEDPQDAANLATLVSLKKENPGLTVLISVGGWLGSGKFSDMALTRESRGIFTQSVLAFIEQYQFDGLDVDWEYPGSVGAGNKFRPEDKQNYTLILAELRQQFDREEKKLHRRLFLTIAAGASSEFLEHTEMGKVQKYVDTVNLMAYDYYEPGSDTTTGNHAPLFADPLDPKKISADRSVEEYEQAGVPAAKIVLGVPFYGHVWGQVPDRNHGLFQQGKPVPNAFADYKNISTNMLSNGFSRYWDAAASVPYLYNAAQQIFVSYEDPESLALKCKYVNDHQLGGIMFWEYESDPSGKLLDAIDISLHHEQSASMGQP